MDPIQDFCMDPYYLCNEIQDFYMMDRDTDTDGYSYNTDDYRWIYCLISFGTPDLMDG